MLLLVPFAYGAGPVRIVGEPMATATAQPDVPYFQNLPQPSAAPACPCASPCAVADPNGNVYLCNSSDDFTLVYTLSSPVFGTASPTPTLTPTPTATAT